jgi:hypothetical protein
MSTIRRALVVAIVSTSTTWAIAQEAALTPAGAERGPNKEGTIPAWEGAPSASGWTYGKYRLDAFKYRDDKPLFTIDAGNVEKYANQLSPGQAEVVKTFPGFKMDVYPSRRTCGIPDFVAENTKKNSGTAKLGEDGWSLKDALVPGFPFVPAHTGTEAMWNAKMRYRGVAIDYPQIDTAVSPRKGNDEWIEAISEQTEYFPWGPKGARELASLPPVEQYVYFAYRAPTALAGQALAITIFLNQPDTETFYYFPGQRRVRRMPSYAYDSPQIGFENQYTLDEPYVFQGTIDRFNWKLVGKKEVIVPYNSFGAYDFASKFSDVVKTNGLVQSHRRYELHRVYVVEATVKPNTRHIAPKRTYYLDEDSWNLLLAEDYDGQGKIFKVREGYAIPVYETGTCDVSAFAQYNLTEGRLVFDLHSVGAGKDAKWIVDGSKGARYKASFYTSDNLRAISER